MQITLCSLDSYVHKGSGGEGPFTIGPAVKPLQLSEMKTRCSLVARQRMVLLQCNYHRDFRMDQTILFVLYCIVLYCIVG